MKRNLIATTLYAAAASSTVLAGPVAPVSAPAGFEAARRPISNPTLFDLALPRTNAHPVYLHQTLPSSVKLANGANLALGGNLNLYAVQFEYALNDRFSIAAVKGGYVDFNPDNNLNEDEGFADLAAGVKYAFILDPVQQFALSGSLAVELYSGDSSVFQGNGDGAVNLSVAALKLADKWQFAGSVGVHLPFDEDEESVTSFLSAHVGYNVTDKLYALAEVNWFHVISEGDGSANFGPQGGSTVPALAGFEGGDLINLGTANPESDIVTAAIGLRYKICDFADLGVAYEIPLTDEEENLMKSRITVDAVFTF